MAIKLIATDLDGTLMAPDHLTVTERTYNALKTAHDRGVKIAIATGRTLGFIHNVTEQLPFCDYVIYSNGASVFDRNKGEDIYTNHIPPAVTKDILSLLSKYDLYYNCYVGGKVYVQTDKIKFYINRGLPEEFIQFFIQCSAECENMESELDGRSAEIVAMYNVSDDIKKTLTDFFRQHGLHITSSIPDEFEVTAPDVNKGTAMKGLCVNAGFKADEVMAFGDALNDLEMLEYAVHSVAMGNACEQCKSAAKYITATNAEDGVAEAVEKYVLNI